METRKEYSWVTPHNTEIDFDAMHREYLEGLEEDCWDYCDTEDEKIHEAVLSYIAGSDDCIYYTIPCSIVEEIEKDFRKYLSEKE